MYELRRVYYCVDLFKDGKTNAHNEECSGQPSDKVNNETINIVCFLLEEDQSYTVDSAAKSQAFS